MFILIPYQHRYCNIVIFRFSGYGLSGCNIVIFFCFINMNSALYCASPSKKNIDAVHLTVDNSTWCFSEGYCN